MARFAHPFYVLNLVLCLPVPILLLATLPPPPPLLVSHPSGWLSSFFTRERSSPSWLDKIPSSLSSKLSSSRPPLERWAARLRLEEWVAKVDEASLPNPEWATTYASHIAFAIPVMAMPMILRQNVEGFLETRVTVMFSLMKLYNLGALLIMGKWRYALAYFFVWFIVSTTFRRPRFLGPSKVVEFDDKALAAEVFLVPSGLPLPEEIVQIPPRELEKLVKSAKEEQKRLRVLNEGIKVILLPWWPRERPSHDVEILHALISNRFSSDKLKFALVDLQRFPSLADDLDVNVDQFGPATGLPCLIMFSDGKELRRLPASDDDEEDGEEVDPLGRRKKPWEWTAESIIRGFELVGTKKALALETPLVERGSGPDVAPDVAGGPKPGPSAPPALQALDALDPRREEGAGGVDEEVEEEDEPTNADSPAEGVEEVSHEKDAEAPADTDAAEDDKPKEEEAQPDDARDDNDSPPPELIDPPSD